MLYLTYIRNLPLRQKVLCSPFLRQSEMITLVAKYYPENQNKVKLFRYIELRQLFMILNNILRGMLYINYVAKRLFA